MTSSGSPSQDAPEQPRRKHWLRRVLVGLVLLLAVGAGVFFWIVQKTRTNPPYSTALALIQSDVQLVEQLGEPIRDLRWLPTSGYPKQFQMQVEGPRGKADIGVTAGEFEGKWELMAIDVFIREGHKRFSLDTGSGAGAAPSWNPGGSPNEGESSAEIGLAPPAGIDIALPSDSPPGPTGDRSQDGPDMNIQLPSIPPVPESPTP